MQTLTASGVAEQLWSIRREDGIEHNAPAAVKSTSVWGAVVKIGLSTPQAQVRSGYYRHLEDLQ